MAGLPGGLDGSVDLRDPMEDPSIDVVKHIPVDFPGMNMRGVVNEGLGSASTLAVINRLYNLREGTPDLEDIKPGVIAKLRQLAENKPLFRGAAPTEHPYPWLFDHKDQDPNTMAYTIAHLRRDEVRASATHAPPPFRGGNAEKMGTRTRRLFLTLTLTLTLSSPCPSRNWTHAQYVLG